MRLTALTVLAASLALAAPAAAGQRPAAVPGGSGRWIVTYDRSAGSVDAETTAREHRDGFRATHRFRHAVHGFAAQLSSRQVAALRADPDVASVTPDRPVHATATLSAGETVPTGIRRVGAVSGTTARGASTAAVAVVDTGIDLTHPDLNAHAGTDCTSSGGSNDDNGHGTHVAGTIGARNDGSGVVGVAPGTAVYAVKVLDSTGSGTDSTVICGLDWVAQHAAALHIGVINMSLGGGGVESECGTGDDPLHEAVCRDVQAGVTVVVAAGNDASDFGNPVDTPAWYPEALTVTAMSDGDGLAGGAHDPSCDSGESDDQAATFSNFATTAGESAHTIAGPGVCILSTWMGGQYAIEEGTSMATPHVAGEVALCLGEDGAPGPCAGLTPAQIVAGMRNDAAAAGGSGFVGDPAHPIAGQYYGYLGRAPGATLASPPDQTPPATTTSTPPPSSAPLQANPPVTTPTQPLPVRRCHTVRVRIRTVHRWVTLRRRNGRIVRRYHHTRVRYRWVNRVRCAYV